MALKKASVFLFVLLFYLVPLCVQLRPLAAGGAAGIRCGRGVFCVRVSRDAAGVKSLDLVR